jgi:hypothetical protein
MTERNTTIQTGRAAMGASNAPAGLGGFQAEFFPIGVLYAYVPASSTSALGVGAIGDYLGNLTIVPTTTSPGQVSVKDGGGSAMIIFQGGAGSVSNLKPFTVPFRSRSTSGGWSVTTSTNVACLVGGSSY